MCEQVCRLHSDDVGVVAAALDLPGPVVDDSPDIAVLASPPPFARRLVLARWRNAFTDLTIELAGRGPSLAELERRFGPGVSVPMPHHGSAYRFRYDVAVAEAPWSCALFASFEDQDFLPYGGSTSTELTLRRDQV